MLADTPPVSHELIYSSHERGFALCSMRSRDAQPLLRAVRARRRGRELERRARSGTSCAHGSPAKAAATLVAGPTIEKSIAPLRSFVAEPMRYGRLFLAGDAAHIVPPTGAKGLNLAARDVDQLADRPHCALRATVATTCSMPTRTRALRRIWRAERFSAWMTSRAASVSRANARSTAHADRRARLSGRLGGG